MSNNGDFDLLLKAAPVIALFIVPPLDRSPYISLYCNHPLVIELEILFNEYYNIASKFITKRFIKENLVFSEINFYTKEKWWCALSYMGVHGSYEHLFNNVLGMLMTSSRLYSDVGIYAVYQALITGGILSALNTNVRTFQMRKSFDKLVTYIPFNLKSIIPDWMPFNIESYLDKFSDISLSKLVNYSTRNLTIVGCSGGVMTLQGMNFAMDIDNLVGLYYHKTSNGKNIIL